MLPLFEQASRVGADTSLLLGDNDVASWLAEHRRTLGVRLENVSKTFPQPAIAEPISSVEASTVLLLHHMGQLTRTHERALAYVEHMLYKQLEAAVGKVRYTANIYIYIYIYFLRSNQYPMRLLAIIFLRQSE